SRMAFTVPRSKEPRSGRRFRVVLAVGSKVGIQPTNYHPKWTAKRSTCMIYGQSTCEAYGMELAINLDKNHQLPLHQQLYQELRHSILNGRLSAGQRIPSTRMLAKSLGVSRATVTLSYEHLISEGYLQAMTGSGTSVSTQLPDDLLQAPSVTLVRQPVVT